MEANRGWHTRGYVPHFESDCRTQFVTWRLADSLPSEVVDRLRKSVAEFPERDRPREFARLAEAHVDACTDSCVLGKPGIGASVQESILSRHLSLGYIHAWAVMPNHVHILVTPNSGCTLADIVRTVKGASSRLINQRLELSGRLWQPDYYDRFIRSPMHFASAIDYIEWNPVKARLCALPSEWPLSSANDVARKVLERRELEYRATVASAAG